VGWYGSAYLLTICSFQLAFGNCYAVYSIKAVFLTAIGIFEFGSLICGTAHTSRALIVGRAIAGMGCAGIFSGTLIVIAYSVPLHQRPIFTGLIGAMYGVASITGKERRKGDRDLRTKITRSWDRRSATRRCLYGSAKLAVVLYINLVDFLYPCLHSSAERPP